MPAIDHSHRPIKLGIFSHIAPGPPERKARKLLPLNLSRLVWSAWLELPEPNPDSMRREADAYGEAGFSIVGIGAYGNLLDPRAPEQERCLGRIDAYLKAAAATGCPFVCTETGTRNPTKKWSDNNLLADTWATFVSIVAERLQIASDYGSYLVLEPYVNNVCRDAGDCLRLMEELPDASRLRFVLDPFNVVHESQLDQTAEALAELHAAIHGRVALAHAKDLVYRQGAIVTPRAGTVIVDWDAYASLLRSYYASTTLVLEHLKVEEIDETLAFVQGKLSQIRS